MADAEAAIDAVAPQDALAAVWRIVEDLNGYLTEQAPWKLAKERSASVSVSATILVTAAEGLRALAVLLNPVMPKSSAALWTSLGAEPALGPLADQRIADVATWGALPEGTTITKVPSLFPAHRGTAVSDAAGRAWPWPDAPEPLPSPVVDNHCHLDHRIQGGLLIDVDDALDRAAAVGVTRIVQVGCDIESSHWAVETARGPAGRRGHRRAAPERGAAAG